MVRNLANFHWNPPFGGVRLHSTYGLKMPLLLRVAAPSNKSIQRTRAMKRLGVFGFRGVARGADRRRYEIRGFSGRGDPAACCRLSRSVRSIRFLRSVTHPCVSNRFRCRDTTSRALPMAMASD